MKIQSRFSFGRRRAQAVPASNSPTPAYAGGAGVAAVASGEQAQPGVFQYPASWTLTTRALAGALVLLSLLHVFLAVPPMFRPYPYPPTPVGVVVWTVVGLALSMAATWFIAALLVNVVPRLEIRTDGLGVRELFFTRIIPWDQIGVLRAMELKNKDRYVVFVPFTGGTQPARLPAPMLSIIPALAGASRPGEHGVLFTSDVTDFNELMQGILSHVVRAPGRGPNARVEAFLEEDAVMPVVQLLLDPVSAVQRITRSDRNPDETPAEMNLYSINDRDNLEPIPWKSVMLRQLPIAAMPAALLLADVFSRNTFRPSVISYVIWAVFLLLLGLGELPFVAMVLQSLGEMMVGSGRLDRAIWGYLELQAPRALTVVLGAALLGAGLPVMFTQAFWFAGIMLTTFLVTRFVQGMYFLPSTPTMIATAAAFIYQVSILGLYYGVR
jgi:hypothetical protein